MEPNDSSQHTPGSLPQPVLDAGANIPADLQVSEKPAASALEQKSQASQQTNPAAPGPINDADTLDPAWVARVDMMIKQTAADPRMLSQEFAKLKAQYIAGRYGKELKQANGKD